MYGRMELRHLRYFSAIAQTLSFSEAARLLHIAQPPLSAQIRSLEDELGIKLFDRSSRGVTLTKAGQAFLPRAHDAIAAARRATETARALASGQSGELRIGLISPAATAELAASLKIFHQKNPSIQFRIRQHSAQNLQRLLEADELDVIFTRPIRASHEIAQRIVGRHEQLLAMPKDHPWASRRSISWSLIDGARVMLITPTANAQYGQNFLKGCAKHRVRPEIHYPADDLSTLIWLTSAGLGICPYPSSLVATAPQGVTFRPFSPRNYGLELAVMWRTKETSSLLKTFVDQFSA